MKQLIIEVKMVKIDGDAVSVKVRLFSASNVASTTIPELSEFVVPVVVGVVVAVVVVVVVVVIVVVVSSVEESEELVCSAIKLESLIRRLLCRRLPLERVIQFHGITPEIK
uniref:Uncharacterized protein n=1 Tax=Glossina pallidipes TaxID=7398 RepID=A0A1A9Z3F5_GLOPL